MVFSKKAKLTAAIYQGITDLFGKHADHIRPKSKGGLDTVENCRILDSSINLEKSDTMYELREWQRKFLDLWMNHDDRVFLLTAIPAAGKTIASLTAARRFLDAGYDRRLLIIVPTDNLREQWRTEATRFGINLQTKEFGTNFKEGFQGGILTYHLLDTYNLLLRTLCARLPTMAILDEPHHCNDKDGWGPRVKEAFDLASRILLLSGTPFRTDGTPIPFIKYDGNGFCIPDCRYDYPQALNDGVVRYLTFDYSKGGYNKIRDGIQETYELNSDLTQDEADPRLREILNSEGDFVADIIKEAHAKLKELRRTIADAAAMAVCIDQTHAMQIANVVRKITGCRPSIIVSDEEIATDQVSQFKKAKTEWLVSVRKVSEGTDIKRLQVLCYFTTAKTSLFFRQLIGRVCRRRFFIDDSSSEHMLELDAEGYVFLPDHPLLVQHAKMIQKAQIQALKEQEEEDADRTRSSSIKSEDMSFFAGSYRDGTASRIIGDRQYTAEEAQEISEIAARFALNENKAAQIFEWRRQNPEARPSRDLFGEKPSSGTQSEKSLEEIMQAYRKRCNKKAWALSKRLECRVEEIHIRFKPQSQMNLVELRDKLATLTKWIDEYDESH